MNYLFRPTPVVVLGRDRGCDCVPLSKPPAGVMLGRAGKPSGRPSRSLATQGAPWIVRSGTMASFGTLGQDGGSIIAPDLGNPDYGAVAPDLGQPAFNAPDSWPAPILPPIEMVPAVAPDFGLPSFSPVSTLPVTSTAPIAPSSQAGQLPGTQPVNAAITAGTGVLNTLANWFRPSAPKTNYAAYPGVGVNPAKPGYSVNAQGQLVPTNFWTGSTILPGTPNATVLLGGAAAVLLLFALMGGRK